MLNEVTDTLLVYNDALHELNELPKYKLKRIRAHSGAEVRKLLKSAEVDPGLFELAAVQEAIHRAAIEALRVKNEASHLHVRKNDATSSEMQHYLAA